MSGQYGCPKVTLIYDFEMFLTEIVEFFQVLIPLAVLAVVEAGFLQAPIQHLQLDPLAAHQAHAYPLEAYPAAAPAFHAGPAFHAAPAPAFHAAPAPTAQIVGLQQTLVKQVAVRISPSLHIQIFIVLNFLLINCIISIVFAHI